METVTEFKLINAACINQVPWIMVIIVSPMENKLEFDIIFISDKTKQEMMLIIRIMFDPIVSTNMSSMK